MTTLLPNNEVTTAELLGLQDVPQLSQDVGWQLGEQGDTLQEVHLRDGGMINSADRAVLFRLVHSRSEIYMLLT